MLWVWAGSVAVAMPRVMVRAPGIGAIDHIDIDIHVHLHVHIKVEPNLHIIHRRPVFEARAIGIGTDLLSACGQRRARARAGTVQS